MYLKRLLSLATLILALTMPAIADNGGTSIADAIPLTEKEDSCLFKTGDTDQTAHYYSYTAAKTGILTISGNSSCGFTAVDASENEIPSLSSLGSNMVPVKEGSTVYIKIWPNMSIVETDFMAHFTPSFSVNANAGKGTTPADPIIIEERVSNIALKADPQSDGFNSYFTYTATSNGVLALSSTSYLNTKKFGKSFDNLDRDFISEYNSGYYVGKVPVRKGETVCIMIGAYSPFMLTCEMTYPEQGTIDNPYDAVIGGNKVSGYYGNYYYEYSGSDADGFIVISSEQNLPRGYVEVFTHNDLYYSFARSESGTYNLRFSAKKNTPYLIHVFKAEDSEEEDEDYEPLPDTMTLTFEPLAAGDTPENPLPLNAEQPLVTSANIGTYYYLYTVPADANGKMLEINIDGVQSGSTSMTLYDTRLGSYYAVYGSTAAKIVATPGRSYMMVLEKKDALAYTIAATLRDINEGEALVKPITAVKGDNNLPVEKDVYYKYTATLTGKLTLTFHIPGIGIEFPISENIEDGTYNHTSTGSSYMIDVKQGNTYYVHISNVNEPSLFSLDEHEYAEGEAKSTAIAMTGSYISMPNGQTSLWYRYTATKAGKLTMSSEPDFIGDEATIIYYCTADNDNPYYMNTSNEDGDIIYYATKSVTAGEDIYIHITTGGNLGGKKLNVIVSDYAEGEIIDNPYILSQDKPTISGIPAASHSQQRWIKIPMKGIESVELTTNRYVSGGAIETKDVHAEYAATFVPDANNDVCTLVYNNPGNVDAIYVCFEISGGIVTLTGKFHTSSGIETLSSNTATPAATYNVAGQIVNASAKGLVIKGGKKYIK